MPPSAHPGRAVRFRRMALCCTILAAGLGMSEVHAGEGPVLTVGEPEGFANLTETQALLVDVYFGGVRRGETQVRSAPGSVTLIDPASTVALLPEVGDRAAVEAALSAGPLASNSARACGKTSDPARCGRLDPEVAGVIFDRERFRLDIFVNPRFLDVQDGGSGSYLPPPEAGIAVINSVGAVISGQTGGSETYYNLQD